MTTDERLLQVIDALVATFQVAQIELNQIKMMISAETGIEEEEPSMPMPPPPVAVQPVVPAAPVIVPPVAQPMAAPQVAPPQILPALDEASDCLGYFDATAPECKTCGDIRKCMVATQAKAAGVPTDKVVPIGAPAPGIVVSQGYAAPAALPTTGLNAGDESLLAELDPQNRQFVIDYAKADNKSIKEVLDILQLG